MKIKRIMSAALIAACTISTTAWADTLTTSYNPNTDIYTLSGTVVDTTVSDMVTIVVEKYDSLEDTTGEAIYGAFTNAADGSFEYSLKLLDSNLGGDYAYIVFSAMPYSGSGAKSEKSIHASSATKNSILKNDFSDKTDEKTLAASLRAKLLYFGLEADFNSLSVSGQESVAKKLLNKKFYNSNAELDNYSDNYDTFMKAYMPAVAVEMLNEAEKTEAADIFDKFETYFELSDEVCYPIYSDTDTAAKDAALKMMTGKAFADLDAMKKHLNESLLLGAISNIDSYGEIETLISRYRSVIPFSLTVYDSTNKNKTANYIANLEKDYIKMSELEEDILAAYKDQNKNNGGTGGGGGLGFGGGGGGGTGGSYVSGTKAEETEPEETVDEVVLFNDFGSNHWAFEAVKNLKKQNIISGDDKGNFNPDNNITREEFIKMLVGAFGVYDETAECEFEDAKDSWAYKYIASAYKAGITMGINDTEFGVGQFITRQDMATLAARCAKLESDADVSFADKAEISDYALAGVKALCADGHINGFEDNTFKPLANATRAESAKIIYSLIK